MNESRPDLAGIPPLAGGRILRRLSAGDSADSWLIETPEGRFVLRVDRPVARRLGLDRETEWAILRAAHAAGLAPRPVHSDPTAGILVTAWVDRPTWRPGDLPQPARLGQLGRLLRRVHAVPGPGAPFDPHAVAQRYARAAGEPGLAREVDAIGRLAERLYADSPGVLCHHDAHAGNLLDTDPPVLLDWEYAASGHPLFDLAVVIRFHRLSPGARQPLLAAWSDVGVNPDQLAGFCRLYDGIVRLWERAVRPG